MLRVYEKPQTSILGESSESLQSLQNTLKPLSS